MPNIALLVPTFDYGGSKRSVSNIANILNKHFPTIVIMFDASRSVYSCDCEIVDLKVPAAGNFLLRVFNLLRRILKIRILIKRRKIDLVISFMHGANLANYYTKTNAKRIISLRGYGDFAAIGHVYDKMLYHVDGLLVNSRVLKDRYQTKYPAHKDKIFAINNVYDTDYFSRYLQESTEEEFNDFTRTHKCIVSVGRISRIKGHTHLLKSFDILKKTVFDAGLIIIGNGEEYDNVTKMAQQSLYKDDIRFLGFQPNPYKYISKCRLFALTSIVEGFPNVLVEALGCGVPVVSTNCFTGPNEILNETFNNKLKVQDVYLADYGLLTPEFSDVLDYNYGNNDDRHITFAAALEKMLTDDDLYNRYKSLSKKRFFNFTPNAIGHEYVNFINKIIAVPLT